MHFEMAITGFVAIYIFMVAAFGGWVIIGNVPAILHTPLMSGSNFVHGIVVIGGIMALLNASTMHEIISQALWAPRIAAGLFGVFGLLGMALAVIGVYGVMAYMVLQRTSEIGIRMAMGAPSAGVLRMFVAESLRLAVLGIAAGLCVALALTRMLGNLLFDISPTDPLTFATVSLILAATALLAGLIPAWRAARIDPVTALREA